MTIYGAVPSGAYRQRPKQNPRSLGFERYALGFNGVSSYARVLDAVSLQLVSGFTFESLFYATGWGHQDKGSLAFKDHIRLTLANDTGQKTISFYCEQGGAGKIAYAPNNSIALNRWNHTFGMMDGANIIIVVNGVRTVGAAIALVDAHVGVDLDIGGEPILGRRFFNGLIAITRVYNVVLTLEEMEWNRLNYNNPVRPGNIVLWLPMEEGAGLVTNDHSGLGNNGSLLPALTPPTWERVRQYELRAQTEQ